jgi:hypothetical protein
MDFIKIQRNELDRLIEQSPSIPEKVINRFEANFKAIQIKKPDICNHLERTSIYKMKASESIAELNDIVPPLTPNPGSAADRIQSFIVKARSESPRNLVDITGIYDEH